MENTNKIYFYKLESPYSEDETKNCKLSITELDSNFKIFKDNIIKDAYFNPYDYSLTIEKYDENKKIIIDLSSIKGKIDSNDSIGNGDNESIQKILISGSIDDNGVLTLTIGEDNQVEIEGFLVKVNHDISFHGDGTESNPIRLSELEKTNSYKAVSGIFDSVPTEVLGINEKYVSSGLSSNFGTLYNVQGMLYIQDKLKKENRKWRVATEEDWNGLRTYCNECDDKDISGKVLKSKSFWEGNDTLDTYGFSVYPTGYVNEDMQLVRDVSCAYMLTSTKNGDNYIVESFLGDSDGMKSIDSISTNMYSIRLVCDYSDNPNIELDDIFGKVYKIAYIKELGQIWMLENLNYSIKESDLSITYNYDGENTITTIYTINNWNGSELESKQLQNGDEITVLNHDNSILEYKVIRTNSNDYILLKTKEFVEKNNGKIVQKLDVGWY
jgi:uncharacterized protein (TIGR02145 family)